MNEEIIKRLKDSLDYEFQLSFKDRKQLLDYITELQDDNITLIKNQINFNSEYFRKIDNLRKQNEELKQTLHNITINGVEEENTTVLDLIKENETLKAKLEIGKTCGFCPYYDYKSRCKRALHLIKHNDIYDYRVFEEKLENILQGSDENE